MLKKILAVALAAAMILGLGSVAFAASFSDTADTARESAIQRLAGLGLLNGYPDGSFRPANPITRAEFSKVIVYAMGLKDAAEMLGGVPVGFSDVPANHWASGFISIAASQNIIKGYPDGTFRPEANVTYAEALTMILRALGYEPILEKGTWPTAYITKAAELKINKGISFVSNTFATRGDVAGLLSNALTVAKLIQVGFGDETKYVVAGTDDTDFVCLLNDMGADYEQGWLVSAPDLFENNGETVRLEGHTAMELAEDTAATGLLGHKVRLWYTEEDDEEIVFFVEDVTPDSAIQAATALDAETIEIDETEDEFDLHEDTVFANFVLVDPNFAEDDELTVILDDNDEPKYAIFNTYEWGVVSDVNTTYDKILFDESSLDLGSISLKDYDLIWSGAAEDLADLEEGDVVDYIKNDAEDKAILVVTRNMVTGEFSKLTSSAATVDGTAYDFVDDAVDVDYDLLGEDVTVYLNKDGAIVWMVTEEEDVESVYAVVVDIADTLDEFGGAIRKLKLVNSDGSAATLNVTSAAEAVFDTLVSGDVIEYETNSSGNINDITVRVLFSAQTADREIDDELSTIEYASGEAKITSSTLVFDLTAFDDADPSTSDVDVITASALLKNATVTAASYVSSGKAKIVVLTLGDSEGEEGLGLVYGSYRSVDDDDDPVWVLRILVNGEITDYETDLDASEALADTYLGVSPSKEVVTFDDLGDEELENLVILDADVASDVYEVRVSSIDAENGLLTVKEYDVDGNVASTEYYMVDEDTLYYDKTESTPASLTLDEVAKMSKVSLYLDADGLVDVLIVEAE